MTLNTIEPVDQPARSISMGEVDLNNLQANILKAHGRKETYHLFLRFTGDNDNLKAWMRAYAQDPHLVTSAAKQQEDSVERKASRDRGEKPLYSGGILGCFYLSAAGYQYLGLLDERLEASFKRGMGDQADYELPSGQIVRNRDPHIDNWQPEYRTEIHAMLMLAYEPDDTDPGLSEKVDQILESLKGAAEPVHKEKGRRIVIEGRDFEHFGYRDGISNPSFPPDDLALVLAPDPLASDPDCFGSYLVYRKLKQDIGNFKARVNKLSDLVNSGNMALTGAQIVGRFKNGTPVTSYDSPNDPDNNNFDYRLDQEGRKCPLHAHIRKASPRDNSNESNRRRIVRRGIPYGKSDDEEVGLLFMCYQSDIHEQFEFIQRVWMDNPNHPLPGTGSDPLVGQDLTLRAEQKWPRAYDGLDALEQVFDFGGYVTLLGGEYFFAPSLSFLKNIS